MRTKVWYAAAIVFWIVAGSMNVAPVSTATAADEGGLIHPVSERFAPDDSQEVPDFQRHVSPLFGRLGCNGRACHGSFQGRGGFRLSLFGYDFKADHEALLGGDKPRVNVKEPLASLILTKPTDEENHEGGERYKKGSWQENVFRRWIESGATYDSSKPQKLTALEITPAEIVSQQPQEVVNLRAVAVWADGAREDVTPLCRFQSNDDQVARVDEHGVITTGIGGDTHVVVYYDNAVVPVPIVRPVSDKSGANYPSVNTTTKIDELVVDKLRKLGVVPSDTCTDAEFLRRVSLDLTGTLPSVQDVEQFLADTSPNKRAEKINALLETAAYAAVWTTKLCDYTGNNDQQLNNVGTMRGRSSQEWFDWIYKRVADNTPYDQLAEGIVTAVSRNPGESYLDYCKSMSELYQPDSEKSFADRAYLPYYWGRRNFLKSEERVIGFAYTFLGIRIQCAQCHKHPFDQWSKEDFEEFKGFFTTVRNLNANSVAPDAKKEYAALIEELGLKDMKGNQNERAKQISELAKKGKTIPFAELYVEPVKKVTRNVPRKGKDVKGNRNEPVANKTARLLGGQEVDLTEVNDPRTALMAWLRSKDNPYFARAFVNRVWASYFNVGIVQPPDDMSLANPPSNKPLLDYLAQGFVEHNFDMKWLHREICNSSTYQRSWQVNDTNSKDDRNFSHSIPRRLPAEAAYDAVQLATASDAKAGEALNILKGRAIAVAAASSRNAGGNGNTGFALQVFGRSIRESNCDCDRSMEASLLQTVFLQNDAAVLGAINGGKDTWIEQLTRQVNSKENSTQLSRLETRLAELKQAQSEVGEDRRKAKQLAQEVAQITQRIERARKDAGVGSDSVIPAAAEAPDAGAIIRQAYLRTLSRHPTEDEVNRCQTYFNTAPSSIEAAKGLLWALVNTKEFIVNH